MKLGSHCSLSLLEYLFTIKYVACAWHVQAPELNPSHHKKYMTQTSFHDSKLVSVFSFLVAVESFCYKMHLNVFNQFSVDQCGMLCIVTIKINDTATSSLDISLAHISMTFV
jgi:hypothetical protein